MSLVVVVLVVFSFLVGVSVGRTDRKRAGESDGAQALSSQYEEEWKRYKALHGDRFKDAHRSWTSKSHRGR